ncbi:MAG: DUF2938 domain-containing protein [Gammaproteobacteria bacterium]|nr:DUF2938 family protein [Gammaproteobacteria bacterium]NIN60962.1 DUF2938 family protein [Gammaproteobacteria bacterium]NIO62586.1 DUF2938 family protein [Gammaproteobacteria bacterium]NIP49497.1 DUF2938 domain-containing protein [Gammaproteobacteria bacterium]NIQ10721.1 DUF2938 domain-containing protein [Gammaproteobacteria bacterium]
MNDVELAAGKKALGWLTHYVIGILYGVVYLWLILVVSEQTPNLVSAIIFSLF